MCCCDDDPPTVFNHDTIRKARKAHKCYECRRVIEAGESYDLYSGIWRDGFNSFKWCVHCIASQKAYEAMTDDHCYCFGTLWEGIEESHGWGKRDPRIRRLVGGMRRKWRHRRGPKKGELMPVPAVVAKAVAS